MPLKFQAPKGTRDLLSPLSDDFVRLETIAREKARLFGFKEIRVPTFEDAALYGASVGAATDIVEKEMFSFTDRGDRNFALRPEGTAGVVRAYLEHSLDKQEPKTQLFYIGNMFRAERPQAGRYREFEQVGFESFGDPTPLADVEMISLAMGIIQDFGAKDLNLVINSIGCPNCRGPYREKIVAFLNTIKDKLCENCKTRMEKNPLRVLDCKTCAGLMKNAPKLEKCADCTSHDSAVKTLLNNQGIKFTEDSKLVRGLDYYTRTVFEITSGKLGAQSAVAGGGRYDGLVELLGGGAVAATGFALGVDRVIQACGEAPAETVKPAVALVFASKEAAVQAYAWKLAQSWRAKGIAVLIGNPLASVKSQMRQAGKGATHCAIVGDTELEQKIYVLKNLADGSQKNCPEGSIPDIVLP